MWECRETLMGSTIWQGQDETGRRIYAVTLRHEGTAVEPANSTRCYGLATARLQARYLAQECCDRAREALA